jgi:hypothetical protein
VGGFVFGLILVNVFARRRRRPAIWPSEGFGPPYLE